MNEFTGTAKSKIQVLAELLTYKNNFFQNIKSIQEEYDIQNNIFVCGQNGYPQEPEQGYMGILKEDIKDLDDIYTNFNILQEGILFKDGKISIGKLYNSLKDVQEEKYIDIKNKVIHA